MGSLVSLLPAPEESRRWTEMPALGSVLEASIHQLLQSNKVPNEVHSRSPRFCCRPAF